MDATATYMAQISAYPVLGREEEHELAVRYRATGDPELGKRLVTGHLRLVVQLAREYTHGQANLLELIQEGNVGLVKSLDKYDPDRGIRLSTYASWWIRAYILRFLVENLRLVRVGKSPAQRKLFFNLRKEQQKLEALGLEATPERVAGALDVSTEDVVAMEQRLRQPELSLDAPIGGDDEDAPSHLAGLDAGPGWRPDVAAEQLEFRYRLRHDLDAFGRTLNGRQKLIFEERLRAESPKTLKVLADRLGLSRERVRQLELRLVRELKDYLQRNLGEAALAA